MASLNIKLKRPIILNQIGVFLEYYFMTFFSENAFFLFKLSFLGSIFCFSDKFLVVGVGAREASVWGHQKLSPYWTDSGAATTSQSEYYVKQQHMTS